MLQALINTMASLVRTYGFTRESMFVTLGMNVLHVALNYTSFSENGAPPSSAWRGRPSRRS